MLVHFFLQSLVLFAVLAIVRWNVAWAYMPLLPVALVALLLVTGALGILLSAINVYLRDTRTSSSSRCSRGSGSRRSCIRSRPSTQEDDGTWYSICAMSGC